jgi:hypothetical protein
MHRRTQPPLLQNPKVFPCAIAAHVASNPLGRRPRVGEMFRVGMSFVADQAGIDGGSHPVLPTRSGKVAMVRANRGGEPGPPVPAEGFGMVQALPSQPGPKFLVVLGAFACAGGRFDGVDVNVRPRRAYMPNHPFVHLLNFPPPTHPPFHQQHRLH